MPSSRAAAQMRSTSACGTTTPPARLCVFSIVTSVVVGKIGKFLGLAAARSSSAVNTPARPDLDDLHAGVGRRAAQPRATPRCDSRLATTSSPGRVSVRSATWLAMVPVGSHSAASLPSSSASAPAAVGGRVFAVLVVAHRRRGDRGAHAVGGTGDGVGAQVDRGGHVR